MSSSSIQAVSVEGGNQEDSETADEVTTLWSQHRPNFEADDPSNTTYSVDDMTGEASNCEMFGGSFGSPIHCTEGRGRREDDTDTDTANILGIEGLKCKASCSGKCNFSIPEIEVGCYCDASCLLYGDCCLDYFTSCFEEDGDNNDDDDVAATSDIFLEDATGQPGDVFAPPENFSLGTDESGLMGGGESDQTFPVGQANVAVIESPNIDQAVVLGEVTEQIAIEDSEDYISDTEKNLLATAANMTAHSTMLQLMTCEPITFRNTSDNRVNPSHLLVITRCPTDLQDKELLHLKAQCESEDQSLQHFIKLYKKGVSGESALHIYSNPYCAMCHGVLLDDPQVESAMPTFQCGHWTDKADSILKKEGHDTLVNFLITHCQPQYTYDFLRSDPGMDRRKCSPEIFGYDLTQCNSTPNWAGAVSQADTCSMYKQVVFEMVGDSQIFFKNPDCAACKEGIDHLGAMHCANSDHTSENEENGNSDGAGGDMGVDSFPTFTLLFDFSGKVSSIKYEERLFCPSGTYHHFEKGECIANTCTQGEMLINDVCMDLTVPISSAPANAKAVFGFEVNMSASTDVRNASSEFTFQALLKFIADSANVSRSTRDDRCSFLSNWQSARNDQALGNTTCIFFETDYPMIQFVSDLERLEGILYEITSENIPLSRMYFFNHWPVQTAGYNCTGKGELDLSEMEIIEMKTETGVRLAFLHGDTATSFEIEDLPIMLSWMLNDLPLGPWPRKSLGILCMPSVLSCDKVFFEAGKYEVVDGIANIPLYDTFVAGDDYAVVPGEGIAVCSDALPNVTAVVGEGDSVFEGILTVIGIVLSLLGLLIALFTYSLFPRLRTNPGLGIMNLSVALFIAQLLFLVAPLAKGVDGLCEGLGSFQHYFWLATFLWMNVLSFDISCTFSNMTAKGPSGNAHSTRFRLFFVYSCSICYDLGYAFHVRRRRLQIY